MGQRRLLVVDRYDRGLYYTLAERFADDPAVCVVRDRRVDQRRRDGSHPTMERRVSDRRRHPVTGDFLTRGFFMAPGQDDAGGDDRDAADTAGDAGARFTVVVPPDRPEVRAELAEALAGEGVHVILERRQGHRRAPSGSEAPPLHEATTNGSVGEDLLYIVHRADLERYQFVKRHFANEPGVVVVYDRRRADRRAEHAPAAAERRIADRRQHDITHDLRAVGWAIVHSKTA